MAGEDFFKFNKGNEFRFSNFREIKEEDLKGADEKTKKLFNIFAGEDKILQEVEAKSLFNVLKSAAGDNQVLEDNEIKTFAKEHIGEEVDTNILATFVNNIFGVKEKPQTQAVQVANGYAAQKQQTFLEEAACKEIVIDIIDENLSEAYEILYSQYLGSISGWHDERKNKNDILKTSNVSKVLDYQNAGIEWMNKAKLAPPNGLTKKEYYEGNKQRIKDMILTRVLVLDTNTKFKELKNKYSEEKLAQIIGDYVEQLCSNASIEDLKDIQKQFVSYSGVEEIQALENVIDNAIKFSADKNKPVPYSEIPLPKFDISKGIIPEYWNSDEPISFEEVYKIERGTEYSQYKIEQYALAKKEMEVVANAYNKKQQFIEFAEGLRKDETLSIDEKTQKILEGFATFYALAEDGGLSQLQELIAESKLPISIDENGFNFGSLDDNAKNRALNSLLKLAQQSKEAEFEKFLNGKTIEDYQIALAQAHNEAIGDENGKMMAEAMKNDNLTCIQRWTGNTSMAGMGMTIVGGILCFTPLAPLGAGMITVGNTLAIGGMVAKTGLGATDYATKDVQTAEEAERLTKDFIMDAGGFIIGMGAGKAGLKAFSKLIDKKLVAVFGQQIASGNKMQALKTVFTNPECLKNFMTAAGAKLSADFVISYAGDLAMMGILDTQDDWQSLLKANLTGILVGMSGDIKDVSGVGRPRNFGVSDGVRPMTEMDYGQRLLGNDVTVADPKTGATVEGTVTGLHNTNGQVEIEVNGQRYFTNHVAEVKGGAKVSSDAEIQEVGKSDFEADVKSEIKNLKVLERYKNNEEFFNSAVEDIYKIVISDGCNNPKILSQRMSNIDINFLCRHHFYQDPLFILEHKEVVREISDNLEETFDKFIDDKIGAIKNEQELYKVLEVSREIANGNKVNEDYLSYLMYSSKESNNIKISNDKVTVDTSVILHLLLTIQHHDSYKFNTEVDKLLTKEEGALSDKSSYGKCVTGILMQKPELLDFYQKAKGKNSKEIIEMVNSYSDKYPNLTFNKFTPGESFYGKHVCDAILYMKKHPNEATKLVKEYILGKTPDAKQLVGSINFTPKILKDVYIKPEDLQPVDLNRKGQYGPNCFPNSTPLKDFELSRELKDNGSSTYSQAGDTYLRSELNVPISTAGVGNCAVIALVNHETGIQTLIHKGPNTSLESALEVIKNHMPEGFDKVTIIPGINPSTRITATSLFNAAKEINPNAQVEFKHFSHENNSQIILYDGNTYGSSVKDNNPLFNIVDSRTYTSYSKFDKLITLGKVNNTNEKYKNTLELKAKMTDEAREYLKKFKNEKQNIIDLINSLTNLSDGDWMHPLEKIEMENLLTVYMNNNTPKCVKTLIDNISNANDNRKALNYLIEAYNTNSDATITLIKNDIDVSMYENYISIYNNDIAQFNKAIEEKWSSDKVLLARLQMEDIDQNNSNSSTLKEMTESEIVSFLGVKKNPNGEYVLKIDENLWRTLFKQLEDFVPLDISNKIEKPLTKEDIYNIQTILSKAATIMNVSDIEPYKLLIVYQYILKNASMASDLNSRNFFTKWATELNPERCALILNTAKGDLLLENQREALRYYILFGVDMNKELSALKNEGIPLKSKEQIETISLILNNQQIPEETIIYRAEGFLCSNDKNNNPLGCLGSCQLSGAYAGKTMGQVIEEINKIKNLKAKEQAYLNFRNAVQNSDYIAVNERFTSCSLMPTSIATSGDVTWELHLQKGSHALFLDGITSAGGDECEILLQKDAKIIITDIVFKENKWKIVADVKC